MKKILGILTQKHPFSTLFVNFVDQQIYQFLFKTCKNRFMSLLINAFLPLLNPYFVPQFWPSFVNFVDVIFKYVKPHKIGVFSFINFTLWFSVLNINIRSVHVVHTISTCCTHLLFLITSILNYKNWFFFLIIIIVLSNKKTTTLILHWTQTLPHQTQDQYTSSQKKRAIWFKTFKSRCAIQNFTIQFF